MTLAAQQVVDQVAALIRAVPAYATKVHTDRAWPFEPGDLPAWKVYADDEEIEPIGPGFPALQKHELTVMADGYCKAATGIDDAMSAMVVNALGVLFVSKASATLSPLNCSMNCVRIGRDLEPDGQADTARVSLHLRVRMHTRSNDPQTIL